MQIEVIYAAVITGVVGPVLGFLAKKWYDSWKLKNVDLIKESIKDVALIEIELHEILESIGADRVWISQFHNGGNFYPTGKSIQKFSIFYEVDKIGISPLAPTFTNIPCSLYPLMFTELIKNGGIRIPSFTTTDDTHGLKSTAYAVGSKSSYIIPLYAINGKYIGNFGVDYVNDEYEMQDEVWNDVKQKASRIAGYLSNYLNKK